MSPLVRRTWALAGHTPVLKQATRSHKKVSVIGALVVPLRRKRVRFYFSLHQDANITAEKLLRFLRQLSQQVQGRFIIVWDRLQAHRALCVKNWLERHPRLETAFLPPYAPELNPVEPAWAYLKHNSMANWVPETVDDLAAKTRYCAARLGLKKRVLRGFLHGPLFLCPK